MNGPIRPGDLSPGFIAVSNPFDGADLGMVADIPAGIAHLLIKTAKKGSHLSRRIPRHERASILENCASLILQDIEALSALIVAERGKTIRQSTSEVLKCVDTLRLSAAEARHNAGEVLPFDAFGESWNRRGWYTREPLGIIVAVTPYDDPLYQVARKLGPAIAGGNAVIVNPSEYTPLSAIKLVSYLMSAGLPSEVVTVATGGAALVGQLVSSRDVGMVSVTGELKIGEQLARSSGLKKVTMELAGNGSIIVTGECDLEEVVESCVSMAYGTAGSGCIGIRRIIVQGAVYEEFKIRLVARTNMLRTGDPALPRTDIGPMISVDVAERIQGIVDSAISKGATLLCGNAREGSIYAPTLLENVCDASELWEWTDLCPLAVLQRVRTIEEALALANDSKHRSRVSVFTQDLKSALDMAERIEGGPVEINDSCGCRCDAELSSRSRYDNLVARESVRRVYEEMTQTKVVCFRG
ncbi:aldehyde dehydrogenase [Caballeronia megalochromosomata]|nr:aldehyde dehydrogenase [Caballeronia megalochromosomata]